MVVRMPGEKAPLEVARVSGQEATMHFSGSTDPPFTLPEPYPFKEQIIVDVMLTGQSSDTALLFKGQPDQFHFKFRRIAFPGKSFFGAHEVSTCKISGCLSYRILDSGPDGTQTTLTRKQYSVPPSTPVRLHLRSNCRCITQAGKTSPCKSHA